MTRKTERELTRIEHQIAEFKTLTNRLNRYWRFLVNEGIKIAKEEGLEAKVVSTNIYLANAGIILKRDGQNVDASELIALTKSRHPSLFRRYNEGVERHADLDYSLKETLDEFH